MDRLKYQKKLSWLAGFLSALGLVFPALARAADQPAGGRLEKVRIAYSAISGSQLVGWIANDAGFFRKNGLDVEFIFIEGGPGPFSHSPQARCSLPWQPAPLSYRVIFGVYRWSL